MIKQFFHFIPIFCLTSSASFSIITMSSPMKPLRLRSHHQMYQCKRFISIFLQYIRQGLLFPNILTAGVVLILRQSMNVIWSYVALCFSQTYMVYINQDVRHALEQTLRADSNFFQTWDDLKTAGFLLLYTRVGY